MWHFFQSIKALLDAFNCFLLSPTEHILCAYLGDVLIKPKPSALIKGLNSPSCVTQDQLKAARAGLGFTVVNFSPRDTQGILARPQGSPVAFLSRVVIFYKWHQRTKSDSFLRSSSCFI